MTDKYLFMPCFSMVPNQISTFNKVFYRNPDTQQLSTHHDFKNKRSNNWSESTKTNKINKSFHGFELSDNAFRTLKRKINWLFYLSKSKSITTYSGKKIYNFKCAFLTFTLPSTQIEPTKEVTSKYFNQLLTELRDRSKLTNYVWRLEFQKNGNVHYHLVTDTYLDYFWV